MRTSNKRPTGGLVEGRPRLKGVLQDVIARLDSDLATYAIVSFGLLL